MGQMTPPPNDPMATVCVSNLPNATSEADILELFSEYGPIQRVRLTCVGPERRSQSHGYFDLSADDVERAVAGVDGHLFKGSIIRVSRVAQEPDGPDDAKDRPAPVSRRRDDEVPSILIGNQYVVATVEKACVPEGGQGEDWYRYVLLSGRSQITGLHRGTLEEVTEYAAGYAELVNARSATVKTAHTCAYGKKKGV